MARCFSHITPPDGGGPMEPSGKIVDGFHFLPPSLGAWIRKTIPETGYEGVIPWTPLKNPIGRTTFALVTSAGISLAVGPALRHGAGEAGAHLGGPRFQDDPAGSVRAARDSGQPPAHQPGLHPAGHQRHAPDRAHGRVRAGRHDRPPGETHYSFYGFQWESTEFIDTAIAPMAEQMAREKVEAALLTPA